MAAVMHSEENGRRSFLTSEPILPFAALARSPGYRRFVQASCTSPVSGGRFASCQDSLGSDFTPSKTGSPFGAAIALDAVAPATPCAAPRTPQPISVLPRSPQPPKPCGSPHCMFTPVRRDAAKGFSLSTPPSAPGAHYQQRLKADIEAALQMRSLPLVSLVLMTNGANCDGLVHEAVRIQHAPALKFLLENGFNNVDDRVKEYRPIHLAVQACIVEGDAGYTMVELLLQHGANPNPSVGDDVSVVAPLADATLRGCVAAVALLLRHGADPNVVDLSGQTPLHHLSRLAPFECSSRQICILKLLVRHGSLPHVTDAWGRSPRQYACDPAVSNKLLDAERTWNRQQLELACGISGQKHQLIRERARNGSVHEALTLPEVLNGILRCL